VFDFELTDEEMEQIRALDKEKRYFTMPYEQQVEFLGSWKPAD
jgi:diketogulonate reductase-like aldo/keto reductase